MDKLLELQEKRGELGSEIRELAKKAANQEDGWTDEQTKRFDDVEKEYQEVLDEMEKLEAQRKREQLAASLEEEEDQEFFERKRKSNTDNSPTMSDRRMAFRSWITIGASGFRHDPELMQRCGYDPSSTEINLRMPGNQFRSHDELRKANYGELCKQEAELRASMGIDQANEGADLAPEETWRAIELAMLHTGNVRQMATVFRTESAGDFKLPTSDDTSQTGELVAEESAASEQTIATGALTLKAYQYSSKIVRVNRRLFLEPAFNIGAFVGNALGMRLGRIQNTHFTTGDASSKPQGLTVGAGDSGITTASNTALTYAELIDIQNALEPSYDFNASWQMNKTLVGMVKKIVDSTGQPLWMPGLRMGEPDTILGKPFHRNPDMPTGASAKAIIYGDLSKYVIRDMLNLTLVRMNERYAEYGEVAFLAWWYTDGAVLDAGTEPIIYATLAA